MSTKDVERMKELLKSALDGAVYNIHHREGWKIFDWVKAAKILKERNPHCAFALLKDQRQQTCGRIWLEHKPFYGDKPFLQSRWDTPVLEINGEQIECYINPWDVEPEYFRVHLPSGQIPVQPEKSKWNGYTMWPDSALNVLGLKTNEEVLIEQREIERQREMITDEEWREM